MLHVGCLLLVTFGCSVLVWAYKLQAYTRSWHCIGCLKRVSPVLHVIPLACCSGLLLQVDTQRVAGNVPSIPRAVLVCCDAEGSLDLLAYRPLQDLSLQPPGLCSSCHDYKL